VYDCSKQQILCRLNTSPKIICTGESQRVSGVFAVTNCSTTPDNSQAGHITSEVHHGNQELVQDAFLLL
jgi:hypothetical protein